MNVHMLIGFTIGSEKIIKALRRRKNVFIFLSDEFHEGPPINRDGVIYLSSKDARKVLEEHPNISLHFYMNRRGDANIDHYEFLD